MGARLSQQWEALHDPADELWEEKQRTADVTNMPIIARAQHTFCLHTAQYRFWNPWERSPLPTSRPLLASAAAPVRHLPHGLGPCPWHQLWS